MDSDVTRGEGSERVIDGMVPGLDNATNHGGVGGKGSGMGLSRVDDPLSASVKMRT